MVSYHIFQLDAKTTSSDYTYFEKVAMLQETLGYESTTLMEYPKFQLDGKTTSSDYTYFEKVARNIGILIYYVNGLS